MALEIWEEELAMISERARCEQRSLAVKLLHQVWEEALLDGVDPSIMAEVALSTALMDMVDTKSEEDVADYVKELPQRINHGEFTPKMILQ